MALPTPEVTELPEEVKRARDAAARRASLRATPTATAAPPTAPVASAAPEAAKAGGWFRRTANALRSGATAAGEVAPAAQALAAPAGAPDAKQNAWRSLRAGASRVLDGGAGLVKNTAGVVGNALRAGTAGSVGYGLGLMQNKIDSTPIAPQPLPPQQQYASGNIPVDTTLVAPPAMPGRHPLGVGPDNEFTRGVANTLNALPGGGQAASAALRVGSNAARLLSGAEKVAGTTQQVVRGAQAAADPLSAAPTASAVNPNYGNEQLRAPVAPQPPTNVVTRTGNSFSGTDIKPGFTYADGSHGKGTVTSLDTSEGHRQNLLELQRNAAERANAPAPAGAAGIGGGSTFGQDLRAKTDAGRAPVGLSPYDAAQLQQQQTQTQQQGELGRAQIAATQTGNNNALRVAEMNNATQRENNAATTRVALRGHELDYERGMIPLKMLQQRMATQQKYLDATKGPDGKEQADPAAAHAAMVRDGVGYAAEDLAKGVTTQLDQEKASGAIKTERAARTRALFNGRGGSLIDPDLKDEAKTGALKAAEDDAHSFARQTVKGFDTMREDEQQALMPQIMGLYELHQKTKNPDHTGNLAWARNLISSQDNSGPANSLREQGFYKGGKVGDRFGALSGALTGGYEKGDVDFNPSGGKNSLRIANPSDNALEVLRRLTQGKDPLGKD